MVSAKDFESVALAIAKAEKKTSAEVVVTVVRQSANYDHVPVLLFTLFFMTFVLGGIDSWIYANWLPYAWPPQTSYLLLVGLAFFCAIFFSKFGFVQRALTSSEAIERWVALRAEAEFFEKIYGKTKSATGVLIFVSLVEHRTVILADKPIFEKVPKQSFDQILSQLIVNLKKNELTRGLVTAVEAIGDLLSSDFAASPENVNEMCNQVIFKDD
jgi:putative membrane protein